jgi:hypothetical protein
VWVWRPTADDRKRIRELYVRDKKSTTWLRHAVHESLSQSQKHIIPPDPKPQPAEPADLAAALDEYYAVCYGDPAAPAFIRKKQTAARNVELCMHREYIGPLLRDAAATVDPATRQMKLTLAETAHAAHVQAMAIQLKHARAMGSVSTNPAWREDLASVVMLSNQVLKIYHALESRRAPRPLRHGGQRTPKTRYLSPPDPGGADSGLAGS